MSRRSARPGPVSLSPVPPFRVHSPFAPAGDQPRAIEELAEALEAGERFVTLLGITGSGKSATIAWTIERVQRPTLVIAPNKSLAAQLASEFREFFPENAVEYFVSYYDYYQPEAYVPASDTYIEKEATINDEIDRLRHSTTASLLTRRDVIVVASVSCIYGIGSPQEYADHLLVVRCGEAVDQREVIARLVEMQYSRNDMSLVRGNFRVRGDTLEVCPAYEEHVARIEWFGDEIERVTFLDPVTGEVTGEVGQLVVFPASHYVASEERLQEAVQRIREELAERVRWFEERGRILEAQRLRMRTEHDIELILETGTCPGIENYSAPIDGRGPGEPPWTLLDFFPDDFLVVIDESHVAVPQLRGQYEGDRSRKEVLIEHGFRLPSAADNRPLRFEEFLQKVGQVVFMSATPGPFELEHSSRVVEQIVRPTGLVDPEVEVRPTKGQIDDLVAEVGRVVERGERVLVTTLTKKMAEDLAEHLLDLGLRVRWLHSEVDTLDRVALLRGLRLGEFDVLVGINLLREGLDLPEVSLVAILDADKEGFLRSETSLIQMIGRAARNVSGRVIMYADTVTDSMRRAIGETNRRRALQQAYNEKHGIDPKSVRKAVRDILDLVRGEEGIGGGRAQADTTPLRRAARGEQMDLAELVRALEEEMHEAARELRFEEAARLRDEIRELKRDLQEAR
ncbi:MAG: UvrABC system protein B [Acidimicrobiales bacterium]|nr:MAG: UvrABC system protein B [Acidimicrobiales bacterium]